MRRTVRRPRRSSSLQRGKRGGFRGRANRGLLGLGGSLGLGGPLGLARDNVIAIDVSLGTQSAILGPRWVCHLPESGPTGGNVEGEEEILVGVDGGEVVGVALGALGESTGGGGVSTANASELRANVVAPEPAEGQKKRHCEWEGTGREVGRGGNGLTGCCAKTHVLPLMRVICSSTTRRIDRYADRVDDIRETFRRLP